LQAHTRQTPIYGLATQTDRSFRIQRNFTLRQLIKAIDQGVVQLRAWDVRLRVRAICVSAVKCVGGVEERIRVTVCRKSSVTAEKDRLEAIDTIDHHVCVLDYGKSLSLFFCSDVGIVKIRAVVPAVVRRVFVIVSGYNEI